MDLFGTYLANSFNLIAFAKVLAAMIVFLFIN